MLKGGIFFIMETTCWICGTRPADSAEHKFKASDLRRIMGEDGELIHFDQDGSQTTIRGKSGIKRDRFGKLKFPPVICKHCNNSATYEHDRAYDKFVEYLADNHNKLQNSRAIDFFLVYGDKWIEEARNLARYSVKHFGCRLMRDASFTPPSLSKFINGDNDMEDVRLNLVIRRDRMQIPADSGFFMDPFLGYFDRKTYELTDAVGAFYSGPVGIRFDWRKDSRFEPGHTQFFNFPRAVLNSFSGSEAVLEGEPD